MATLERHTLAQLYRAVTRFQLGVSENNSGHLISPVITDELRSSPDADVECVLTVQCRTVAALARRVLRVSASARRVAAAYGSASH